MLYVSSSCIQKDKIADVVQEYAKCGIKNIELSGGTRYYSGWQEELLELKNKYNLNYVFHAYFPPPEVDFVVNLAAYEGDVGKKSLEYYLDNIPVMRQLGCDLLSIHAGFFVEVSPATIGKSIGIDKIYDREKAENYFIENYQCLEREAKKSGITLLLENNVLSQQNYENFGGQNYFMLTDFVEYDSLQKKMPFQFLLDLAHLYVSCHALGLEYESEVERLIKNASWLHISENAGIVDDHGLMREDSMIMRQLMKHKAGDIPITMETKGTLEQVVDNYHMVLEKIK